MNNKLELVENAVSPRRAYEDDAGLDLAIQEDTIIPANQTAYLPAGVKLHLKENWLALVVSRSGTFKKGLTVTPTLIDKSFNGNEISTIVSNHTDEDITVEKGMFLGQILLLPYATFSNERDLLPDMKIRPENGKFGSSDN